MSSINYCFCKYTSLKLYRLFLINLFKNYFVKVCHSLIVKVYELYCCH